MAYINKPKKTRTNNNINKNLAQKHVYNTPTWKSLRITKLQNNPLCEECLKNEKITAAVEVHHIQAFMTGMNIQQIQWLGFDYSNLMSLCEQCHSDIHSKKKIAG